MIFELLTLISVNHGLKLKYFISIISELRTELRLIYDILDFKIRKTDWPQSILIAIEFSNLYDMFLFPALNVSQKPFWEALDWRINANSFPGSVPWLGGGKRLWERGWH